MEDILTSSPSPGIKILRTDGGAEWGGEARKFLIGRGILLEVPEPNTHAWLSRTDRLHRTLRQLLGEHFERPSPTLLITTTPAPTAHYPNFSDGKLPRLISQLRRRR